MSRRALVSFVCLLSSTVAVAQPPPAVSPSVAAPAPAAAPLNPRALPEEAGEARLRALLVGARGLTSDEVARRAVEASRELVAGRAGTEVSRAKEAQATAQFWPKLQISARYTRLSAIDPLFIAPGVPFPIFLDNYQVGAQLAVPVSDYLLRISRAISAAEKSTAAARSEEAATRRKVAADARIAYYEWIAARGAGLVLEQRLAATAGQVKDAQRLYEAGFASRADVLRAESGQKAVELALLRAREAVTLAEQRLRVVMRDEGRGSLEIGENLIDEPPPVAGLEDVQALLKEAQGARPELAALQKTEAALRDLERLYGVGRLPRLDVVGNAYAANPNQRIFPPRQKWDPSWDVSFVLSWTPTDIPGASANQREQAARAAQLVAQREALVDGLALEVRQAVSAVRQADASIATTVLGLRAAEAAYRVRRELFNVGKATLVEVMDAESDLTRARLEVVNAHVEARIARVRFAHAVGRAV